MRGVGIVSLYPLRAAKRGFSVYFALCIPTKSTLGALLVPLFGRFLRVFQQAGSFLILIRGVRFQSSVGLHHGLLCIPLTALNQCLVAFDGSGKLQCPLFFAFGKTGHG